MYWPLDAGVRSCRPQIRILQGMSGLEPDFEHWSLPVQWGKGEDIDLNPNSDGKIFYTVLFLKK